MYNISNVNPGDLIRSSYIDGLVAAILDLNTRVTKLEAGQTVAPGVSIFSVSSQSVTVNDTLTITGANFSTPAQDNTVTLSSSTLGTIPVTNFMAFGTTSQFSFTVPAVPGLATSGSPMTMTVVNANGASGTYPSAITVNPFVVVPRGSTTAVYDNLPVQQAFAANAPVQIGFTASSTSLLAATYSATATVVTNDASGTLVSGWSVAFVTGGIAGTSTTNFNLAAAPSPSSAASQALLMQVTATAAPSGTAPIVALQVVVTCTLPGALVQPFTLRIPIQFGQSPQPPNSTILLVPESPAFTTGVMTLARNASTEIIFKATTSVAGSYVVAYAMSPSTGWNTPAGTTITNAGPSQPASSALTVSYTPGATSAATATLTITVTYQGSPSVVASYVQQIAVSG